MDRAGLALVLTLALAAACAPAASLRPAAPLLPGRDVEIGGGAVALAPRPYADEPWRGAAQAWGVWHVDPHVELALVGSTDLTSGALGVVTRVRLVDTDRFALAVDIETGWLWAALAVPVAVRTFGQSWAYTAPFVGLWGPRIAVGAPVGFSLHVGGGTFVRAEGGVTWPGLDLDQRRFHLATGVAVEP